MYSISDISWYTFILILLKSPFQCCCVLMSSEPGIMFHISRRMKHDCSVKALSKHDIMLITTPQWLVYNRSHTSNWFNLSRPGQNGHHFVDEMFNAIFVSENIKILINISLTFVPKTPTDYKPPLVHVTAWCRTGDKPLSELILHSSRTDIYGTREDELRNYISPHGRAMRCDQITSYIC